MRLAQSLVSFTTFLQPPATLTNREQRVFSHEVLVTLNPQTDRQEVEQEELGKHDTVVTSKGIEMQRERGQMGYILGEGPTGGESRPSCPTTAVLLPLQRLMIDEQSVDSIYVAGVDAELLSVSATIVVAKYDGRHRTDHHS